MSILIIGLGVLTLAGGIGIASKIVKLVVAIQDKKE